MYSCQSLPSPRSQQPQLPSKRSACHTAPRLQSHGKRGKPTLGSCRNSTGVPSHPLQVTVAKVWATLHWSSLNQKSAQKGGKIHGLLYAKQPWYWQKQLTDIQNQQDPLNTHVFWLSILRALSVRKCQTSPILLCSEGNKELPNSVREAMEEVSQRKLHQT